MNFFEQSKFRAFVLQEELEQCMSRVQQLIVVSIPSFVHVVCRKGWSNV